jgi:hypothetical protein
MKEMHWSDIELDPQEGKEIVDQYFTRAKILTARIWSKHPRSQGWKPLPEIEVSAESNWKEVGAALREHYLARVSDRCDCYSCRSQGTKRGLREKYWVSLVTFADMGDPSELVDYFKSPKPLTQSDRKILAELLDCFFSGELLTSPHRGRPKNMAAQALASVAIMFYKEWQAINRKWKITDWGHSDEMKDEACRFAIDRHQLRRSLSDTIHLSNDPMNKTPDFEQVRDLIGRPRSRRQKSSPKS